MSEGYRVIPGTSYTTSIETDDSISIQDNSNEEADQLFSMVLYNDDGQVFVTAESYSVFAQEINTYLKSGYKVVAGTIYATSIAQENYWSRDRNRIEQFFSIVLER
jgi:hypothetical protein